MADKWGDSTKFRGYVFGQQVTFALLHLRSFSKSAVSSLMPHLNNRYLLTGATLIFAFCANAQCPISVSAGPDVQRCNPPAWPYLGFTWTPTAGMSGANTLNPTVTVNSSTNYILSATAVNSAINLITNGDFEAGNSDFSSAYAYSPGDLWPEGVYDVLSNPSTAHTNFPPCSDHTGGSGNMMAVNGSGTTGVSIWCQTISVSPNTQYAFSAWATALVASSPARLQFSINGTPLGSIFNVSSSTCNWQNFYAIWNSGGSTSATICIINQNTAQSGNDFALDDISFSPVCRVSDTVRVEILNVAAVAAPASVVLPCDGALLTLSGLGSSTGPNISYSWSTVTGNIVSGENSLSPVINAPGVYTLTVEGDFNGQICQRTANVNVLPNPTPLSISINNPPTLGCNGAPVTLVSNPTPFSNAYSYQWAEISGGNIVGPFTNKNVNVNQPGVYEVIVTNNATGCSAVAWTTVTASTAIPVAHASADTINCVQTTAVLSGAGSTTGNNITYAWTALSGSVVSGQNQQNAEAGSAGTYVLVVRNTSNNCVARDTVVVVGDSNLPFQAIQAPPNIDCDSDTIRLFVDVDTPAFVLIVWVPSNGGNIASGGYTPAPNVSSTGIYTVYTTDPLNGCTAIDSTAVISNYAPPTAETLQLTDTLTCQNASVQLSGANSSTGPNYGYEWTASPGGNVVSGANTLNPTVNAPGLYTLTVINYLNGCTASSSVAVLADTSAVQAIANAPDTLNCAAAQVTLNAQGSTNGPAMQYAWTTTDGLISAGANTPTPTAAAAGTYQLLLTNTQNGCTATDLVQVQQDSVVPQLLILPTADLSCASPTQSIVIQTVPPPGNLNFSWTASNGGNLSAGQNSAQPTVNAAGQYQVVATNPQNGCSATASTVVNQAPGLPVAEASAPGPLNCDFPQRSLSASGSSSGPEYQYNWSSTLGGNILSGATGGSPVVDAPGWYFLQVRNQNNGCIARDSVWVDADKTPPPALAGPDTLLTCAAPQQALTANAGLPTGNLQFQWASPNGQLLGNPNATAVTAAAAGLYVLSVTNPSNGCSASDSLQVLANQQLPTLLIAAPDMLTCQTQSVFLAATATGSTSVQPIFQWQGANGGILGGANSANPEVGTAGGYTLLVTDPANGCTRSGSAMILQDTLAPDIQMPAPAPITCANPTRLIAAQNADVTHSFQYSWSATNGGQIGAGAATLTPTASAGGLYILETTDLDNGCAARDSVFLAENTTLPTVEAGNPDTLNCTQASLALQGSANGAGSLSFQWTASNGGVIGTGANTLAPTVTEAGLYALLVTDQSNGCTASDEVAVAADADLPLVEAGPGFTLNCQTQQTTLQGSGSSGANFGYLWTSSDGNILSAANSLNPVVDAPGTYQLLVTNLASGCTRSDAVEILENTTPPTVSIATPLQLTCGLQSVQLSAQSNAQQAQFAWQSTNGNIVSGANSATPIVNQVGNYAVTVSNPQNGCTATASTNVGSNTQPPQISIATPGVLTCTQTQLALQGTVIQPVSNYSIAWVTVGGQILSGANGLSPVVAAPGAYQMNVLNQLTGCNTFLSINVTENKNLPQAAAASNQPITCDSATVHLSGQGSSVGQSFLYAWAGAGLLNGGNGLAPEVGAPGPYTLTVTDQDNGCSSTATTTVALNTTPPIVNIATPQALNCLRDTLRLDAQGSSSGPGFALQWSSAGGLFLSGQNTLQPLIAAAGAYVLDIENLANGCENSKQVLVNQNITAPSLVLETPPELHCDRPQVQLQANSTTPGGQYAWGSLDGQIVGSSAMPNPTVSAAGNYQVTLTDPSNGCTAVRSVNVVAVEPPLFEPVLWQPTCLEPEGALDFGPVSAGKPPFAYSIDGGQSYSPAGEADGLAPGAYALVLRDAYGCTAAESVEIEAVFLPEVDLPAVLNVALGDVVQFQPVLNFPENEVATWAWSPAEGLSCADCPNPTLKPTESSRYTLTIKDLNGCSASASIQLRVNKTRVLYAPNVFAPQGDGRNSHFNLFGKGVRDVRWLRVYDRWGNQVYAENHLPINDATQGWNGTHRGQRLNPAVFVWQASVEFEDGVAELFSGDVLLIEN
jgi:gliding motility-associated-like protein